MTWNLFRWVWRLEAPLFIGMPPAGALNRCRLYVPARVLWGAATAEMSRSRDGDSFPDYGKLGWEIGLNCRFTYLYPAERISGNYLVWLPEFKQSRGLIWRRQDGKEISDREFRQSLLDARPGTAIAPETDSASEGTLRETECINPRWRNSSGHEEGQRPVFLLGYLFLRNNSFRRQMENIETLLVGGDTRYGLGKMSRECWDELSSDQCVFNYHACTSKDEPQIIGNIVLGHALEPWLNVYSRMCGTKELLSGWDQGTQWKGSLAWIPGSYSENKHTWSIDNYGYWICQSAESCRSAVNI